MVQKKTAGPGYGKGLLVQTLIFHTHAHMTEEDVQEEEEEEDAAAAESQNHFLVDKHWQHCQDHVTSTRLCTNGERGGGRRQRGVR